MYNQVINYAQVNYVPNPSFEDLIDCDLEFGQADKAVPWQIMNLPIASPDLFHSCSTNPFYVPFSQFTPFAPSSGDGMVGLVNSVNSQVDERIYARLLGDLPVGIDIYVAYSIRPREVSGEFTVLCYSNTQSLIFSDIQFQNQEEVLLLDTIFDYSEDWTLMQTCYQAKGSEKLILIGNFKSALDIQLACENIERDVNFAYFYVDDIIVSPFDVVPDTLFLCGDDVLNVDASFYDVPIKWSDGQEGAIRTIDQGGKYLVFGDLGDCLMTDQTIVIELSDEDPGTSVDLCENGELILESPVPAVWENGDTSTTLPVAVPGIYTAKLQSTCGEVTRTFFVEEADCSIRYFVPNAFSPNFDGINDRLEFFFKSDFSFSGTLNIFDRWGNRLFTAENVDQLNPVSWNGRFKGQPAEQGVYIWSFQYESTIDGKTRVISGSSTLIR